MPHRHFIILIFGFKGLYFTLYKSWAGWFIHLQALTTMVYSSYTCSYSTASALITGRRGVTSFVPQLATFHQSQSSESEDDRILYTCCEIGLRQDVCWNPAGIARGCQSECDACWLNPYIMPYTIFTTRVTQFTISSTSHPPRRSFWINISTTSSKFKACRGRPKIIFVRLDSCRTNGKDF